MGIATFRVYGDRKGYSLDKIEAKQIELYRKGYSVTAPFIDPWKPGEWNIAYDYDKELGHCYSLGPGYSAGHFIALSDSDGNITEDRAYCVQCERDFSELIEF